MAEQNTQGLVSMAERSPEERRALGRRGGLAAAEARRRRRTLREELLLLLSDGDVQRRVSAALVNEAIEGNRSGSVARAFEILRDTIGEKPAERLLHGAEPDALQALSTAELRRLAGELERETEEGEA